MNINNKKEYPATGSHGFKRREFLKNGFILGSLTGISGLSLLSGCKEEAEEEISPSEDLMLEHGLLNRILLIYDACKMHLINREQFPPETLYNSALIIRSFIEEYHEKLENDFIFPRFMKAGHLADLVQVLIEQHTAGRYITDQIIKFGERPVLADTDESQILISLINDFNRMYRPHEAREDTILFPQLRKVFTPVEYFDLGEDFEKKEHELFGEEGFEKMVEKVAAIERQMGIYELSSFTPVPK